MQLSWITAPLIGGLIGLITNSLAIKMLFRPHRAVYIGKFHTEKPVLLEDKPSTD